MVAERDPSSAWKTPHGEWRIVTYNTTLYGSTDFHSWYEIGQQQGFDVGECPSLMPLPRDTQGSGPAPSTVVGRPTHVYKNSHSWADFMQVGSYTDGPPGKVGVWKAWETAFGNASKCIDGGAMYATKDMPAPGGRRLYWGWTAYTPPAQGVMSLPRELTWHPELQQLVHSAVPELSALRELPALADVTKPTPLTAGVPHSLITKGGLQAEVEVTFALPLAHNATLGVIVMEDTGHTPGTTGMIFWWAHISFSHFSHISLNPLALLSHFSHFPQGQLCSTCRQEQAAHGPRGLNQRFDLFAVNTLGNIGPNRGHFSGHNCGSRCLRYWYCPEQVHADHGELGPLLRSPAECDQRE